MVICHNGTIYQYKVGSNFNAVTADLALNIYEKKEALLSRLTFDMDAFEDAHRKNIDQLTKALKDSDIELKEVIWYGNYKK